MVLGMLPTLSVEVFAETPELGANDVYSLRVNSYLTNDDGTFKKPGNSKLNRDKTTITLKYWDEINNKIATTTTDQRNAGTYWAKAMKDPNYTVSMTVYPADGYTFADSNEVHTYFGYFDNGAMKYEETSNVAYTLASANDDNSRTYTFKYTEAIGTALAGKEAGSLYFLFEFKQASTYDVDYYPIEGDTRKITISVTEGMRAPELTDQQLTEFDADYFAAAKIVDWYTKAPKKQLDNTFTYSGRIDNLPIVTAHTSLYARTGVKDGGVIYAEFRIQMRKNQTSPNMMPAISSGVWILNPSTKEALQVKDDLDVAERKPSWIKIPVGKSVGEASTIAVPVKYSELISNYNSLTSYMTKNGARIEGWYYQEAFAWKEYTKDTIIPDSVIMLSLRERTRISILPKVVFSCTATFHTGIADLTIEPYEYEVLHDGSYPKVAYFSEDELQLIENKIKEQEEKEGSQVFKGWYLTEDCTPGEEIELTSAFSSDVNLYAKWVDPCTITYDLKNGDADVPVENADAYKSYTVGVGDRLTAPERPVASDNQKGKLAFMGWYKDENLKTPWNFTDTVSEPVTLHAKWVTATPLTVQFKKYNPDDLATAADVSSVTVPVATGYTFGTLPELPNSTEGEYVVGKDRDIKYTDWMFIAADAPNTLTTSTDLSKFGLNLNEPLVVYTAYDTRFTFTFIIGEGTPTPEPQIILKTNGTATGKATKPKTDPSRTGYDFGGWYKDADGNTEFKFAGENGAEEYDKNTTIYAKWVSQPEYTVTFDLTNTPGASVELSEKKANGTVSLVQPSSKTETEIVYKKLQRGSYTYTCSAKNYLSRNGALTIDANSSEQIKIDVKLVAFVPVTKVSLKTNQVMRNKSHNLDTLAVITPDNATNQIIKWTLAGTYSGVTLDDNLLKIDAGCTETQVTLTATVANGKLSEGGTSQEAFVQENINLSIIPYVPTISFRNGKTAPSVLTKPLPEDMQTNSDGRLTATISEPEATGYDFAGWYLDKDCTEAQKWDAAHVFETDSILYAKWVKKTIEITVTFSDGGSQTKTEKHNAGESLVLPANMFTKKDHIFVAWELPDKTTQTATSSIAALPESDVTYTATWKEINSSITKEDITQSLLGITDKNAADHKPQLIAARDALAAGTATKTNAALIAKLSELFADAGLGPVEIAGDAKDGVSEVGAILSSDGAKVVLTVNKLATPGKTLPEAYQNAEYKSAWYSLSMTVGGTTTEPKVPVILTMPIPAALSEMAADTIRVLLYKGAATEPIVMTPTVNGSNLTFAYDGNGQLAFVGKSISDAADTRVTALEMRYNGTKMGNVEQDANGNFTVTLPSTTSESVLQDLASGINSKWVTYMTVAPKATVKPSDGGAQNAEYWAKTGLTLTYSLTNSNKYSDSKTFTVTAENGTTRNFTVTVKKITSEDRTYKIAVSNINGGTVTASPSPAAAGEEVKLTVTPNDGKKLVAGSLSYCLQSAGAKSVPIDESSLTFIMPAGDININAQFEDDANAPLKNPPQITAFVVNGVSAVINSDTKAITIILPYGTDLKHVAPTIVTANASKVEPSSAQRVDLSTPKAYRVYASNGAYVTYTVTAYTEEPSPTQSLWEKLQNQINSNPNWWELAEYQKKTGYYK